LHIISVGYAIFAAQIGVFTEVILILGRGELKQKKPERLQTFFDSLGSNQRF
jgi:hypothetical protein